MKIFLIGDTHFLHKNIIKYCNRPENHEQLMIDNWNKVVSDEDIVFHLGDIAAGIRGREQELIDIFSKLNGKKTLIRGNHDHKSSKWYKEKLGFHEVLRYLIMGDVLLFHYPLRTNSYSKPKEIVIINEIKALVKKENVKHIIHGHVHQRTTSEPNHFNVSVEAIRYTPIEINDLLPQS